MQVYVHLTKFYDWAPIPPDVKVTDADRAAGLVLPGRDGTERMRVLKLPPNGAKTVDRHAFIAESMIIGKIIEERCDVRRAGRVFTRRQAVAQVVMEHVLMSGNLIEAEASWIDHIEVHDSGPDEDLFRKMLSPHHEAMHAKRGGKNIDPKDFGAHLTAYLEPADSAAHAAHLEAHFSVSKAVA